MTADLELDFKAKKVVGTIKYDMERLAKGIKEIVLDTRLVSLSTSSILKNTGVQNFRALQQWCS